ncbi:hypothetical protein C2G38_2058267, partial [Gigaspora rosea]
LMLIACEFLFDELAKYLETHLIETKAHWLRLNFTRIYQKFFRIMSFKIYKNGAMILWQSTLIRFLNRKTFLRFKKMH